MGDLDHALAAYENALRHNPMSLSGLTQVASIARIKENYPKVESLHPNPILPYLAPGVLTSADNNGARFPYLHLLVFHLRFDLDLTHDVFFRRLLNSFSVPSVFRRITAKCGVH